MDSITVKAHAKVNLYLKVLSRRKDSYHNIATLFERISLHDVIRISKVHKGIVVKSDKFLTKEAKDNLVYKAAEALMESGKVRSGVKIEIEKNIPIAAGLGGGSSDAASVLTGMNELFGLKLKNNELIRIGRKIGADVPFFLLNTRFAAGKGIGDKLNVLESKVKLHHLLVYPGFKVNTKDVYRIFDGIKGSKLKHLTGAGEGVKIGSPLTGYRGAQRMLYNDLERACLSKESTISAILESLAQLLGKKFIVSGSGPSLFCLYRTGKEAMQAKRMVLRALPQRSRRGWQIFTVSTA